MASQDQLRSRIVELIAQGRDFLNVIRVVQGASKTEMFRIDQAWAGAWLASASAVAEAILPDPKVPHRRFIASTVGDGPSGSFREQVRSVSQILVAINQDINRGLFTSIADEATALAFDGLLDHADEYLTCNLINVAGVIAGVAFEDSMRRARATLGIEPDNISIEDLISALAKQKWLSPIEARRARAAQALRTSATHARWEEFKKEDVESCIHFTRQFIGKMLESPRG